MKLNRPFFVAPLCFVVLVVSSFCGLGLCKEEGFLRMKTRTLGGIHDYKGSQNSAEIESLARFAVEEHNKKENTLLEFARVVKAKEQVVAGKMYHLTLEAVDAGQKKIYEAKVWVKPWINFKQLQEFKHIHDAPSFTSADLGFKRGLCKEEGFLRMKTQTLGGIRDCKGSQNSAEIESMARFAVEEHNKKENALLEFARVVKAKEQVVAGKMYHLTLEAVDAGQKRIYEAKVWVKPWINFKQLQEFKHIHDAPSFTSADLGFKRGD